MNTFLRTELLIGSSALQKLQNSSVAVFGLGGVGSFVVEGLARSGVGKLTIIDNDTVQDTNLNRQLIATTDTIGKKKTTATEQRIKSICPSIDVQSLDMFVTLDTISQIDFTAFDYVVDAIDTVSGKLAIISRATMQNIPVISCMGTGGKLNPLSLTVTDISKTQYCPLARVMRRELKSRGISHLKVVYSPEETITDKDKENSEKKADGKRAPSSMIFVPGTAGLIIASQVVNDLIKE